ncbi:MAG: bifunctional nuclease family protein [Proteobacteria bacterium]|nr:bifunctional nuclease family protein [Pseudomonadota bacterium]
MSVKQDIEMFVVGLLMDPQTNSPIVVLKDLNSDLCLPIWIGLSEATSIATVLKKVDIQRPMTHDLLKDVIEQLGGRVLKVVITSLKENTFLANIEIVSGEALNIIDARPSDAIALAVREECPIIVSSDVIANAKVTLIAVKAKDGASGDEQITFKNPNSTGNDDSDTLNFSTIEKEKWAEILDSMDPEDFKYKM